MLRTLCLFLILLAGCASDPWERHDDSLYQYLKYATPESREGHVELLGRVVSWNRDAGRTPPPGVMAEYGYFLALQGEQAKALEALDEEARLYPEAAPFVGALRSMVRGQGSSLDSRPGDDE